MRKLIFLFLLFPVLARAGGIKGTIYSTEGNPLPFATIYVEKLNTGTTTNGEAYFELSLPPGTYHLVFQYMGYESSRREVSIGNSFVDLQIKLEPQVVMLQNIEVTAADEEPAYAIMRQAIAKSMYHQNQVDQYTSTVYLKGSGGLTKIPWLACRELKKEGIDTSRTFVMESITKVTYERPATYKENVISIRSDGEDNSTSPMMYINASFYDKEIAGAISPLSPSAFSYYRFEYEGTFMDRGYAISKIKVIPRSKGDDVFSGMLHIVEDDWSIYSLDLDVIKLGIKFSIKQRYAPINDKVWLPVSHRYFITGKFLGFGFEYQYLASISDYDVQLNPDLPEDIIVVDEKKIKSDLPVAKTDISELNDSTRLGRKTLRKMLKEYEKAEQKSQEEPDVIRERSQKVDSLAYKKDSSYWQLVRPIPLSNKEIRGYQQMDSVAMAEKEEERLDSVKTVKRNTFKIQKVITGGNFKLGKHSRLEIDNMVRNLHYNTVEGVNLMYGLRYQTGGEKGASFSFGPQLRYAWDRDVFNGRFNFKYKKNKNPGNSHTLSLESGRFIFQYNEAEPITPFLNTLTTLLQERNLMKIYEKDYLQASWRQKINYKWQWKLQAEYATRYPLQNNADWTLIENNNRNYTSNFPFNAETETEFPQHNAFTTSLEISWQPGLKFTKYNNVLQPQYSSAATYTFGYRSAFDGWLDSDVSFNHLYLKLEDNFEIGIRGTFTYTTEVGGFLNKDNVYFMDYKHFMGNQTPFLSSNLTDRFRLLEYYRFSTREEYLQWHSTFQWRKFLLTQFTLIRMTGIRENLVFNYLTTNGIDNYMEVGYGIDYILRLLRLEAVTSWENGKFRDFGIRLGLIANIEID